MSEIESKVKAIIVDKLGVDEAEVKPEASFTNDLGADSLDTVWSSRRSSVSLSPTTRLRRLALLATLSHTSRRTQNKFLQNIMVAFYQKQPLCFIVSIWN